MLILLQPYKITSLEGVANIVTKSSFIKISTVCLAVRPDPLSANVPGVTDDYDGMMDALTDIQEKGDNMMAGIW